MDNLVYALRYWALPPAGETRKPENADLLIEAADEIERLRHEVKLREQICADATLYARRLQEAADEIERLRGLLREGLDHHDEYNWQQRVREALDDE